MRAKTSKGVQKQNYRRPLLIPPLCTSQAHEAALFPLSCVGSILLITHLHDFFPTCPSLLPFFSHSNSYHPTCPSLSLFFSHTNSYSPLFTHHNPHISQLAAIPLREPTNTPLVYKSLEENEGTVGGKRRGFGGE